MRWCCRVWVRKTTQRSPSGAITDTDLLDLDVTDVQLINGVGQVTPHGTRAGRCTSA